MNDSIIVNQKTYSIPRRFRIAENMHIVFWLFKDISWAMKFRILGIAVLIPTLLLALLITWQTRKVRSELYHNIAVTFWIAANGYWMICEFYWEDLDFLRYFTAIPFSIGILSVGYYYGSLLMAKEKAMPEL
jgi:hypothetical protein